MTNTSYKLPNNDIDLFDRFSKILSHKPSFSSKLVKMQQLIS